MSDVVMPQMGESIVEGTITKWMKKVGDRIERDEPLFEISTDKVDSEVPSPVAGILEEILVQEGETVEINTLVARVGDGSGGAKDGKKAAAKKEESKQEGTKAAAAPAKEAPAKETKAETGAKKKEEPTPQVAEEDQSEDASDSGERIRSSPLVRRLAKEHGIDLRQVKGSGQGGRISKHDIEAYRKGQQAAPAAAKGGGADPTGLLAAFRATPEARFGDYTVEPLSTMRRKIAEHMVLTKRFAAHVSTVHQIDCTAIAKERGRVKDRFLEQNGVKLTFMPFFLRAAAAALKEFPSVNASLDGSDVIYHRDVNIGVAVALDGGLIVPVIKKVDEKSVLGLQRAVIDLADRARKKQLKPDEVQQGTFSISNYGGYGSLFATPAINQPQVAILGLGAIHKAPVVIDDAIAIRSISYVTLTFDHRLLDGAVADQFVTHLKGVIEGWKEPIL
jgi:2-oxoglutarate dehydrogenase E2 component (dihydrolipoamide succinyltransferase)